MFLNRKSDRHIVFIGSQALNHKVINGNSVELRIDKEKILVSNIVAIDPPNQYRGVIYGFEPSFAVEYNGLTINQEITFSKEQIFGCNSD